MGATTRQTSEATGATVSSRKISFDSQPEQIKYLRTVVEEYRELYAIRARARDIAFRQSLCPPRDKICQALAIAGWVQRNITYVEEYPEIFQTPTTTVAEGYGDCDDFTTLIAAMCESIGIDTELVGIEWGPASDRYVRHIFPRAVIQQGGQLYRVPLDATLVNPLDGRENPIEIAAGKGSPVRIFVA
jgi:transglutaminase-like putative cysteine protease